MEIVTNILKSGSKVLAFCVFWGGFKITTLLIVQMQYELAVKVFFVSAVISGLLSGSKIVQGLVEKYIEKVGGITS